MSINRNKYGVLGKQTWPKAFYDWRIVFIGWADSLFGLISVINTNKITHTISDLYD